MISSLAEISVYSHTSSLYADKFSFTEIEVLQLIQKHELDIDIEIIRGWYGGYQQGEGDTIYKLYNSLSIIRLCETKKLGGYFHNDGKCNFIFNILIVI